MAPNLNFTGKHTKPRMLWPARALPVKFLHIADGTFTLFDTDLSLSLVVCICSQAATGQPKDYIVNPDSVLSHTQHLLAMSMTHLCKPQDLPRCAENVHEMSRERTGTLAACHRIISGLEQESK